MTNQIDQIEKVSTMIDTFSTSFGSARAAIYFFPKLQEHTQFTRFLNSFLTLLRRANCRPAYSWIYDSNREHYNFILIINGYFRNDVQDITDVAQRLWSNYSTEPINFIADIPVKLDTLASDKQHILDVLDQSSFFPNEPQRILNLHQRAFACSRLF